MTKEIAVDKFQSGQALYRKKRMRAKMGQVLTTCLVCVKALLELLHLTLVIGSVIGPFYKGGNEGLEKLGNFYSSSQRWKRQRISTRSLKSEAKHSSNYL